MKLVMQLLFLSAILIAGFSVFLPICFLIEDDLQLEGYAYVMAGALSISSCIVPVIIMFTPRKKRRKHGYHKKRSK